MTPAINVVKVALKGDLIGTPYSKLDCQALMEKLLTLAGVAHINWRGSNHMYRDAVINVQPITDPQSVPLGAWIFTVKHDGGEIKRGYHDNKGNAAHVGMYLGDNKVIHSTTGGVQWDEITSSRWTHFGLCKLLSYDNRLKSDKIDEIIKMLEELKNDISGTH